MRKLIYCLDREVVDFVLDRNDYDYVGIWNDDLKLSNDREKLEIFRKLERESNKDIMVCDYWLFDTDNTFDIKNLYFLIVNEDSECVLIPIQDTTDKNLLNIHNIPKLFMANIFRLDGVL